MYLGIESRGVAANRTHGSQWSLSRVTTAIPADTHIARGAQGLLGVGLWSNWPYPEGDEDGLPPAREETIKLVNDVACPSCEVTVLDMRQPEVAAKAQGYGIRWIRPPRPVQHEAS
jgi:hypothetical protein